MNVSLFQIFRERIRAIRIPGEFSKSPVTIDEHFHRMSAEETLTFAKICALPCLYGLLPSSSFLVWKLFVRLLCGLLHPFVPKTWVQGNEVGGLACLVKQFLSLFLEEYGPVSALFILSPHEKLKVLCLQCHMTPNFHYLLHLQVLICLS
jgi:hypothetical protein